MAASAGAGAKARGAANGPAGEGAGVAETGVASAAGMGVGAAGAFADRLIPRIRELGHPLCVGLDPHWPMLPPLFAAGARDPHDERAAEAVERFCSAILERVAGRVAIVKPQSAFFEQLGWRGLRTLERLTAQAHALGLLVLLDAKRGDIGSTAEGYASAHLGSTTAADALTVNPYLGFETLLPFEKAAQANGRGLFVLVKTSNPGSGDLQDRVVDGEPLYLHVARGLAPRAQAMVAPGTGWSSLGIVCGAPWPEQARRVREILPNALFLVPGYGAQGASAADAVAPFVSGPAGLEGGIVNSSRAILFPEAARAATDARAWERAIDTALDRAIGELADAVRR